MLVCPHCRIALRENETQCPRDGHAGAEVTLPELPAELAERFTVVEPFAHGDSGTLWLVDDPSSGRRGLLKLLRGSDSLRAADRQRIRREWTKQATLDSPHLARLYESGDVGGQLWCLREWVEGLSLAAHLSHGQLDAQATLALSEALAAGLDALHRAGLLHRDVKPGHIVVEPQPGDAPLKVTLIDAGCPAALSGAGGERLWGTPAYLAPEQAAGKLVSFRSDLYSLGCVLYEAFTGAPPFVDEDDFEVIRMHREHDAPEPPEGLPGELTKLMTSLLAKEPQRRPFSAQKVRKSLAPQMPDKPKKAATATFITGSVSRPPSAAPGGRSVPPPPPPSQAPGVPSRPPARATSAPPPVPPGARSKPPAPRPSASAGSVPPPVPGARSAAPPSNDATQPISLEQVVAVRASASAPPPVPSSPSAPGNDHTQPLELDQLVAVREHFGQAKRDPGGTEPIELDQLQAEGEGEAEAQAAPEAETTAAEAEAEAAAASQRETKPSEPDAQRAALEAEQRETLPETDSRPTLPETDSRPTLPDAGPGEDAAAAGPAARELPEEKTQPGVLVQVRFPEEEPRSADGLLEAVDEKTLPGGGGLQVRLPENPPVEEKTRPGGGMLQARFPEGDLDPETPPSTAPAAAGAPEPKPNFVDALAGPDPEDEEDDQPTNVVALKHIAGAMRSSPPASQAPAAGAPVTSWDDAALPVGTPPQPTTSSAFDSGAPASERQAETTQVIPNPFASAENRNRLMLAGGAAALFLLLLVWAFSGEDEPEVAAASETEQTPDGEATPSTTAAEREPAPAKEPAIAEAPTAAPIVEPIVEEQEPEPEKEEPEEVAEAEEEDEAEAAPAEPNRDRRSARRQRSTSSRKSRRARRSSKRGGGVDKAAWERARAEARAHYSQRKYDRAERAYEQAAAANPRHAGTFAGLGASRLAQGKNRGAVQAYKRAVGLAPGNAAFHAALGHAYARAGDKRRARAAYQKALSLDRGNKAAKTGLARL